MITNAFTKRLPLSGFGSGYREGSRITISSLRVQRPPQFTRHSVSVKSLCLLDDIAYTEAVPKLWTETIAAHRREVRDAIVDTTVELVAEHGLLSVTMSRIAEETGIGRATLYKHFADVESILRAWLEGHIDAHLAYLAEVRDRTTDPRERLAGVLEAYALHSHQSHKHRNSELAALLHRHEQIVRREHQLHGMLTELLSEGARSDIVRDDISPGELASFCIHALGAAKALPSKAAIHRLVEVTLDGLRPGG